MIPIRLPVPPLSSNLTKSQQNSISQKKSSFSYRIQKLLPDIAYDFTSESRISITLLLGFRACKDLDNGVKYFIDNLAKKYKFNDRQVFELIIRKQVVNKGSEFIEFSIKRF